MYPRIRQLREERGLSEEEIASYLKCRASSYRKYESGEKEAKASMIYLLALYYGVSSDYILGRTDTRGRYPSRNEQ